MSASVKSMAYVTADGVPWWVGESEDWGQGVPLSERLTASDIIGPAGIDFEVSLSEIYTAFGSVEGYRAIVRADTGSNLGVVTDEYVPIQNRDIAAALDEMTGGAKLATTAGVLCGDGHICWMALDLGELKVPGEPSPLKLYAVAMTGHDGRHRAKILLTTVRPVCQNTLRFGAQMAKWDLSLWHTGDVKRRLAEGMDAMAKFVEFGPKFEAFGELMVATPYTEAEFGILASVLTATDEEKAWVGNRARDLGATGWKPTGENLLQAITEATAARQMPDDLCSSRTRENRDTLTRLFSSATGVTAAQQDTAWAALQALSEYTDHHLTVRGGKRETAAERSAISVMEGKGFAMKEAGLTIIQAQTGTAEAVNGIFAAAA